MVAVRAQALGETIIRLQQALGLSIEEVASALGVTAQVAERWQHGESMAEPETKNRLDDLVALHDHLYETLKPDAVPRWLRERPRYLGGDTPADTIARGDFDRIEALLTIIDYGMFA
jgi:transcriptional regulator with XRE-family HTH domain